MPGLGCALVALPDFTPVRIIARGGALVVHSDGATVRVPSDACSDAESWLGLRRLTAQAHNRSIAVHLDDLDPYRDGYHAPAAARLSPGEVAQWQQVFAAAWDLLAQYAPGRADELAAGLRSLVPLMQLDPRSARSATVRDAFGTFGLTLPSTAADFAVALVHEFQHSKLSGVLDLMPLYNPAAQELYFAPWRTDPRPVGGLLQGVYAFVGIADLWWALRACPALAERAEQEFASVREQVRHALASLEDSCSLNPAGRQFTAGMRAATEPMLAERLPANVVRRAKATLRQNRNAWRQRNGAELRR
jgi:HEXXH motif-containing protein